MSPHDFRRFALAHELLARGPATPPVEPAGMGAAAVAATAVAPAGLAARDREIRPARADPPSAHPAAPGGEADQGRIV